MLSGLLFRRQTEPLANRPAPARGGIPGDACVLNIMRVRVGWVLVAAFFGATGCGAHPPKRTPGSAEVIPAPVPSAFDRSLDRARREAGRGNWKVAMAEAQSAFRDRPECREARALLEEVAPSVWAEWGREISRRREYSTCVPGISPESMAIVKHLRDGQRFESAGMPVEALEQFREAEIRILLLPPEGLEYPPQDYHRMAREGMARLSPPAELKR